MERMQLMSELCRLFCWPPWPPKIAAKLAFLPPDPSYRMCKLSQGGWQLQPLLPTYSLRPSTEAFYSTDSGGHKIACLLVRSGDEPSPFTILFSHGNAADLGDMVPFFNHFGPQLGCDFLGYDYSGYGCSDGHPTESQMHADALCAWNELITRLNVPPERVILYGQSLGTVPTVRLATKFHVAGVILHSPFMSAIRVACPGARSTCCDSFKTLNCVNRIASPVLVIHGTEDEVIDFSHGQRIYERCKHAVEPLWLEGAGHNNIQLFAQYKLRLRRFIKEELAAAITTESSKEEGIIKEDVTPSRKSSKETGDSETLEEADTTVNPDQMKKTSQLGENSMNHSIA